jgi:hypothetical protein
VVKALHRKSTTAKKLRANSAECCPFFLTLAAVNPLVMHIGEAILIAKLNAFERF